LSFAELTDGFVVTGAAEGSVAARAGILPGDRLIAADGVPVVATSVEELEIALAGPPHSEAVLTFERRRLDGSTVRLTRRVARATPGTESAVSLAAMLDPRTGYLRIASFLSPKAGDDVHAALARLRDEGMQRLVLDLRDNPGGIIEVAAHVAGEFLPAGSLIYTSEGRKRDATDTVRVKRSFLRHEERYPIAVLINGGTASAAELVAGALQDHDRGIIVGRPSFGKALMMKPIRLADGSVLMLVVGHVRTPCGRIIQRSYRGLEFRDYYNRALSVRDTTALPSCKTDAGRTVYGGGGIFPDVPLSPPAPTPVWLDRLRLDDVPLQWLGGYLDSQGSEYVALDSFVTKPAIPDSAIAQFRAFAASRGDSIPGGTDDAVRRLLMLSIAQAKWGPAGYYRAATTSDPDVAAAVAAFDRSIVAATRPATPGPGGR
jgi:carboxyl-terminal processing protease